MHQYNEQLVKLCANHQAWLLSHQGLSAILDLNAYHDTADFLPSLIDATHLEILIIDNYKAYATYSLDILKLKQTINIDKPPENYYQTIHRPDAEI